jgi:hypothetical protein
MLLFAIPIQRNAPAILSHSFDRRPATLQILSYNSEPLPNIKAETGPEIVAELL